MSVDELLAGIGVSVRGMREGDMHFISRTWPRPDRPAGVDAKAWATERRRAALATIRRARVVVLCSAEHETTIEGWAAAIGGVLLGLHLRPSYLRDAQARRAISDALVRHAKEAA